MIHKVSVILPAYNCLKYIDNCIQSIQNQTLSDFEFIIIDDCSTDGTFEIIKQASLRDKRIRPYRNKGNSGICFSLNRAIALATSDLVARMDADDISHPDRLKKQFDFLETHPDVILVGTNIELIDENNEIIGQREYPQNHDEIVKALNDYSPFCHPSVMFRKEAIVKAGGYREQYRDAEDYDLWLRLKNQGKMANIQEYLLQYRIHPGQVTVTKLKNQHRRHMAARREHLGLKDYPIWHKLRGKSGSLGSKYMTLAYQQNQLGQRQQAVRLAFHSLLHSPLSKNPWKFLFGQFRHTHLYNNYLWYRNKLRGHLGF